jgi:uncharacterized membrane protein
VKTHALSLLGTTRLLSRSERSTTKKVFLTIGWFIVYLCISIIWLAVKNYFHSEVASIKTSNPMAVASFFAALVTICKVGLLVPFWFIWRKPKIHV